MERKKSSIEMETAIKLILFLLSVIVVFSIFKLVISKVFTNIGLEMCSISFSLEKKAEEINAFSGIKNALNKGINILLSNFVGFGCSPAKENVKISSKEDLLIDLLFKFKKICDITAKGSLEQDKVELYVLNIKSKKDITIEQMDLMKLKDAKLLMPNGKMLDITLGEYCNNILIIPLSENNKKLVIEKNKENKITIYYERKKGEYPKIYVEY